MGSAGRPHIDVGWEQESSNMERLDALINWAQANQLSFHVTEKNVWLREEEKDY